MTAGGARRRAACSSRWVSAPWSRPAGPLANFVLAIVLLRACSCTPAMRRWPPVIGAVTPGSPAAAAGIEAGRPGHRGSTAPTITDFQQLPQIISVASGEPLAVAIQRGEGSEDLGHTQRMKTRDVLGNNANQMVIGVRPDPQAPVTHANMARWGLSGPPARKPGASSRPRSWGLPGSCRPWRTDQLTGPRGHCKDDPPGGRFGFLPLLNLVAILSVSIGLVNLFPIPLLDGGHLLYYGCEAVLGRPLGSGPRTSDFGLGWRWFGDDAPDDLERPGPAKFFLKTGPSLTRTQRRVEKLDAHFAPEEVVARDLAGS